MVSGVDCYNSDPLLTRHEPATAQHPDAPRRRFLIPQDPRRVTIYLCGPTVYNYVHIGNARGPVVFGLLVRLLKHRYGADHVVYARNVTDVDDKINAAAAAPRRRRSTSSPTRYRAAYDEDIDGLGVDAPDDRAARRPAHRRRSSR